MPGDQGTVMPSEGSFFMPSIDPSASMALCTCVVAVLLLGLLTCAGAALTKLLLARWLHSSRFFLCHHKASAGCLSRLLKMDAERSLKTKLWLWLEIPHCWIVQSPALYTDWNTVYDMLWWFIVWTQALYLSEFDRNCHVVWCPETCWNDPGIDRSRCKPQGVYGHRQSHWPNPALCSREQRSGYPGWF